MIRAVVPRNCRPFWILNSVRGLKTKPPGWRPFSLVSKDGPFSAFGPYGFGSFRGPFWNNFEKEFEGFAKDIENKMGMCLGRNSPGETRVWHNSKEYEAHVDVHYMEPENIKVKLIDNRIIVSGKHEQKKDEYGFLSREFTREFSIPENVDLGSLTSSVENSCLIIRAKVKDVEAPKKERVININIEKDTDTPSDAS